MPILTRSDFDDNKDFNKAIKVQIPTFYAEIKKYSDNRYSPIYLSFCDKFSSSNLQAEIFGETMIDLSQSGNVKMIFSLAYWYGLQFLRNNDRFAPIQKWLFLWDGAGLLLVRIC